MKKTLQRVINRSTLRAIAAAFVISFFVFIGVDLFSGKTVQHAGTIVNKVHIPASTHIHTNVRTKPNGQTELYYTTTHDPEKWFLYVESLAGHLIAVDSQPEVFYTRRIGQVIPYLVTYGRFTSIPYFPRATNNPTHNYEKSETTSTASTY